VALRIYEQAILVFRSFSGAHPRKVKIPIRYPFVIGYTWAAPHVLSINSTEFFVRKK
jgi:hypothetical protein